MEEKTLVIFELYNNIEREEIMNFEIFKTNYTDLVLFEDLRENPHIIGNYKIICDCTNNLNLVNFAVQQGGIKLKDGEFEFYKFNEQMFFSGTPIQHCITTKGELSYVPEELKAIRKKHSSELLYKLEFYKKYLVIKNTYEDIQKGFEKGIEYNIEGNKRFVITKKIPDIKEENTEYITNSDIPIVKDILEIMQYIKQ